MSVTPVTRMTWITRLSLEISDTINRLGAHPKVGLSVTASAQKATLILITGSSKGLTLRQCYGSPLSPRTVIAAAASRAIEICETRTLALQLG
jgi:hypothetical protein